MHERSTVMESFTFLGSSLNLSQWLPGDLPFYKSPDGEKKKEKIWGARFLKEVFGVHSSCEDHQAILCFFTTTRLKNKS
ncbi:Hypothetical predicted protein [Marmota monax]|uniref:Uncharacterized protein n=1 Tax=Marmota monax TaxID=9995 RepID=A0A5E4AUK9_MARMO|nr:hypothetical protein GHT09_002162 [Marmota monax]VTJ60401.1 Hypothetical predicted protein [Marmota monax]